MKSSLMLVISATLLSGGVYAQLCCLTDQVEFGLGQYGGSVTNYSALAVDETWAKLTM